jgi:hypothetical protein
MSWVKFTVYRHNTHCLAFNLQHTKRLVNVGGGRGPYVCLLPRHIFFTRVFFTIQFFYREHSLLRPPHPLIVFLHSSFFTQYLFSPSPRRTTSPPPRHTFYMCVFYKLVFYREHSLHWSLHSLADLLHLNFLHSMIFSITLNDFLHVLFYKFFVQNTNTSARSYTHLLHVKFSDSIFHLQYIIQYLPLPR